MSKPWGGTPFEGEYERLQEKVEGLEARCDELNEACGVKQVMIDNTASDLRDMRDLYEREKDELRASLAHAVDSEVRALNERRVVEAEVGRLTREREDYREKRANEVDTLCARVAELEGAAEAPALAVAALNELAHAAGFREGVEASAKCAMDEADRSAAAAGRMAREGHDAMAEELLVEQNIAIEVHDRIRALAPAPAKDGEVKQVSRAELVEMFPRRGPADRLVCTCSEDGGECVVHQEIP